ncbi:MAG TPA: hypothetical protein PK280_06555 [Planctomycetota bacterium]|nr:hypothetical protein [Planctomycetota bacterium]
MKSVLVVLILLAQAVPCLAKARYAGKADMIREAEAIAVATVTKVEVLAEGERGTTWTYRQKATVKVEGCLKGEIDGEIAVYGMEDLICAQCSYTPGRFILFLRKDGMLWAGSNWELGIRPIRQDKVAWPKEGGGLFDLAETPLAEVIAEIRAAVASGPAEDRFGAGRVVLDWTIVDGGFHLEVKNDTKEVFVLDEFFAEGANLVITGLNAKHEKVYVTPFDILVERAPAKLIKIGPGNYHRIAFPIADCLKTTPNDVRYIAITWTRNPLGTKIPDGGLSTSRYECRKAVEKPAHVTQPPSREAKGAEK